MKKIVAVAVAAAGLLWALGQRKSPARSTTWAEGTDAV